MTHSVSCRTFDKRSKINDYTEFLRKQGQSVHGASKTLLPYMKAIDFSLNTAKVKALN